MSSWNETVLTLASTALIIYERLATRLTLNENVARKLTTMPESPQVLALNTPRSFNAPRSSWSNRCSSRLRQVSKASPGRRGRYWHQLLLYALRKSYELWSETNIGARITTIIPANEGDKKIIFPNMVASIHLHFFLLVHWIAAWIIQGRERTVN